MGEPKDAQKDAEETGVFCWNVTTEALAEAMNYSAAPLPAGESEFDLAKLSHSPARLVDAPIVNGAPLVFECRYLRTVAIPNRKPQTEEANCVIVGEVLGMHLHDSVLTDGKVDVTKLRPVARLGYSQEYTVVQQASHDCACE
jgi:flavin reductase (DIM6/NTAB) family NADH-FMN oxidoreductase RutF